MWKTVFLIMALSVLIVSCRQRTEKDTPADPEKNVSDHQLPESDTVEADLTESVTGGSGEVDQALTEEEPLIPLEEATGEQEEKEDISGSAVYDTEEKTSDAGRPSSESGQETNSGNRSQDEGEMVIPSN